MNLSDINNDAHKVNKLLSRIRKEYGVSLSESSINKVIKQQKAKINWMVENVTDTTYNPEWNKATLIHRTFTDAKRLLEYNDRYRVDPKTGALLDYSAKNKGDNTVSARPDLYWRSGDEETDSPTIPLPLSAEELQKLETNTKKTAPSKIPSQSSGMYVGIETPGADGTVINNKDGKNKVVTAKVDKSGVVKTKVKTQKATASEKTNNTSLFSNMRGSEQDKYKTKVASPIAGTDKKRMNEDMSKNHILMLAESEIEKAQIVMAVNNEVVEKLQRDAEKMSNMKIDVLGPIVERIKAEHGLEPAENFRDTITRLLDQALDTVMQVKDQIHTETLKLTGDISSAPSMEQDLGMDAGMGGADLGMDAGMGDPLAGEEFEMTDEFSADAPELEPVPAEREMKEAATRLGVVLESKSGKMGKKYFNDAANMRSWLTENKSRIAKVHKIIKD